jgi:hypothetical protein
MYVINIMFIYMLFQNDISLIYQELWKTFCVYLSEKHQVYHISLFLTNPVLIEINIS